MEIKKWYPILGRFRLVGIRVKSFDPGLSGRLKGAWVSFDPTSLRFIHELLMEKFPRVTDREAESYYKRQTKADEKFWKKYHKLPRLLQDFIQHIHRGCLANGEFDLDAVDATCQYYCRQRKIRSTTDKVLGKLVRAGFLAQDKHKMYSIPAHVMDQLVNA